MRFSCIKAIVAGATVILFASCARNVSVYKDTLDVLGGSAEIVIVGVTAEKAQAAIRAVEKKLQQLDQIGYTFESTGELQALNAALAENRSFSVSPEFARLLQSAATLSRASRGLFNPAAGALTALWEFHCKAGDCEESPYPEDVQHLVDEHGKKILAQHPSMEDLVIEGNSVSSRNPAVKLELGDVIRGFALDEGMRVLKASGIKNAMIQLDGGVRTVGSRGDHPWWVGIPVATDEHVIGFIEDISDEAVVTVRAFDRSMGRQDTIYRHVVDPRSGVPVRDIQSVTVIHDSAAQANAAATVFVVNGIEGWSGVAADMGVQALMVIASDGTIYTSPRMEERLHWKQDMPHQHLIPNT